MAVQPILINGEWKKADAVRHFQAENPATKKPLSDEYPVSSWKDCDEALDAAVVAAEELRSLSGAKIASFLERYAERIEARADDLVEMGNAETGLAKSPRLADAELPRTTNQLRQAAESARNESWRVATIDTKAGIRSAYGSLGPVCVFGPNNFPFAFGSISGGDFAAAIAAGNPVIAKANSSHPGTTRIFAEEAMKAVEDTGLPKATVQLIYRTGHADGEKLVADPRNGATGYTGSRGAGLKLKEAADKAGNPIYLELSSINPVAILPGALEERFDEIVEEFKGSCLLGAGQFCTNPGLVILMKGGKTDAFIDAVAKKFDDAPVHTLLSKGVQEGLADSLKILKDAGAELITGGKSGAGEGYSQSNTLLSVSGSKFLAKPEELQSEAFGNTSLVVVADDTNQARDILRVLEGNLTACIYSHTGGDDDKLYDTLAPYLRQNAGRLLNDKMPTGVAVSPAMNHGGPYPATGHPGFTAVGIPASIIRFGMLQSFDNVRPHRLPSYLQDKNPNGEMWRLIDLEWTTSDVK
ncbi:MAG: aldehyde dehydrogenase (NADP(+)) [Balneolaceae bacterium]